MRFGSLIEIYTTIYGWELYGVLAEIFMSTGLFLVPFAVIIYRNWTGPAASQENRAASATSLSRMQLDIYVTLLVMLLAFFPLINLNISAMSYGSVCMTANQRVDEQLREFGQTTYATSSSSNTKVPVFWYLAMSLGSGINYSTIASFPCITDIPALDSNLRNMQITDPAVKAEYNQFINDCYMPAKRKFKEMMNNRSAYSERKLKWAQDKYENYDPYFGSTPKHAQIDYIGSTFFLETEGFYKQDSNVDLHTKGLRATAPIEGWTIDPNKEPMFVYAAYLKEKVTGEAINLDDIEIPDNGRPDCAQWWSDTDKGLEVKLLNSAQSNADIKSSGSQNTSVKDDVELKLKRTFTDMSPENLDKASKELVIRSLQRTNPTHMTKGRDTTTGEKFKNAIAGYGAAFFADDSIVGRYAEVYVAKEVAPMIQAMFLLVIYMLIPIVLLVSCYDLKITFAVFFLIITIKLFTLMWAIADYMYGSLFRAMYPDESFIYGLITGDGRRLLLDIVLYGFIIVSPIVLLAVMGVAGYSFSSFARPFNETASPVANIGREAKKNASKAVKEAVGLGKDAAKGLGKGGPS